jgi:uncharacterized protein DUF2721
MQGFELEDLLKAVGPTASLIFAAWIFLTYLQARYSSAYEHYRELIAELRQHREHDYRRTSLEDQIIEYKLRCEQMRRATDIGVMSAILLISALVFAALGTMFPTLSFWKYLTAACAIVGLLLVVWAAAFVIIENRGLQRILDEDLSDNPDLAKRARDSNAHRWSKQRPAHTMKSHRGA